MTNNLRLVIFPASRSILASEQMDISQRISSFLIHLSAHGEPLYATLEIVYQQFIIIKIDENKTMASGCSLDNLNGMMREIEAEYQLGIFDRMKACFLQNNEVKTLPLPDFRTAIRNKELPQDIKVFDFSLANDDDFQRKFLLPIEESWAKSTYKKL